MPPPAVIGTIVGKIPAEENAAFVAQVGEPGRITSRAGSVDISSAALTAAAMDDLNATIFPPAQLRALEETGVAQFDFVLPGVDGTFTALAGSIAGDRWLEIRRRSAATPPARPAVESTAAQALDGLDDLTEPAGFESPAGNMDSFLDGLTLSDDVLEGPALGAPNESADEGRRETDRPAIVAADSARAQTAVDSRPRARRLIRVALPVAACLLVALVVAGYFGATRRPSVSPTAAARPSAAAPTSAPPARASAAPLKSPAPRQEAPAAAMPPATSPTQTATSSAPAAQTVRSEEQTRSGFSVQVAAVRTRDEADRLVTRFADQGYPAYVVRGEGAAANFYRVRIGTFADRDAAKEVARQLEGIDGVNPWIATEIPGNKPAASRMLRMEEGANRR
jgi:cell division septation protein DedD